MRWRTTRWGARVPFMVVALALAACGDDGGDGDATTAEGGGGARSLRVRGSAEPPGAIDARDTTCRSDGDRQLLAAGVVRNAGDRAYQVSISVRFLDADGVRVDLASDSVSDLRQGESARWSASVYVDDPASAVECRVDTSFS